MLGVLHRFRSDGHIWVSAPATPASGQTTSIVPGCPLLHAGAPHRPACRAARPAALEPLPGRPAVLISVVGSAASSHRSTRCVLRAFVLVLRTQLVNAIAFLAGWTLALSLLFVIVLVPFAGDISTRADHRHRTAASVAEIAIGACCSSSRRPRRSTATTTRVGGYPQAVSDGSTTWTSGERLDRRVDPAAGADGRGRRRHRPDRSGVLSLLIGFAVFAIVSTAALLGIFSTYHVWRPESARIRLTDVVSTLERQGPIIFTVLCGAGGGFLVVDGLRDLVL